MKEILHFQDAIKIGVPVRFSAMIKPVGSQCNLDCKYCYYLGKGDESIVKNQVKGVMSRDLLERFIRQYIEGTSSEEIAFIWHGGEPLLAGLNFYKLAMELQAKYDDGRPITNSIQTNGTLLNPEWSRFFKENKFLVGISMDGPKYIHDYNRTGRGGVLSFDRVFKGLELLKNDGVEFNTLSVISKISEKKGAEIYNFFKDAGSHFMQFLPAAEDAPWGVSGEGYGRFMIDIFKEWMVEDIGRYFVQLFDVALGQWYGAPPALCSFAQTCGDSVVVEMNGDVFSCDHFVTQEHFLGNISNKHLKDLVTSEKQRKFGFSKRNTLPQECLECKYLFACRGGCPKYRYKTSSNGEKNLSALCEGYKLFFDFADPYLEYMAKRL